MSALEGQISSPHFGENKDNAQQTIKKLKSLKGIILPLHELQKTLDDIECLSLLAEEEQDEQAEAEVVKDIKSFTQKLEKIELRTMFSDPHDHCNAYLSINAGAGGTESCDWVSMLFRMYSRWVEKSGLRVPSLTYYRAKRLELKELPSI